MTDKKIELRKQAEGKFAHLPENIETMSPEEIRQTLHELRVHQLELEIQNEELRRTQMELNVARARYFDLYDLAPVGYVTVGEKGVILEANLTAVTLLGVKKDGLVGRPFSRFIAKEDQESYYRHRKLLFDTGAPQVREMRMVKKDGTEFWAHLEATTAPDDDGAPGYRVAVIDITARKRAEETLNNRMSFISTLLDTIPCPIFYKDTAGKYLGCNRAYEEIIGKSREEVVGKDIYDLYPSDIADLYAKKDRELYEHPGSQIYDGKFNVADGKVRDVIINKATYVDTSKNLAGLIGIFLDITERRVAEEALQEAHDHLELRVVERTAEIKRQSVLLRENEERFHAIADYSADWENWVGPDGKLRWINRAVLPFTGYSEDECLAMTDFPFPLIDEADHEVMRQHLAAALHGSRGNDIEFRIRCKDGRLKWAGISWQPIYDSEGVNLGHRSSVRDITDRKRNEEALQIAMQAAEVASQAKSAFLVNMSHEIRTPLNGVLGMAGLLLGTPLTDRQRDYAEKIRTSSQSLFVVLNGIMDLSKIAAGNMFLENIPFSLGEVIGNVARTFGPQAAEKGIALHTHIDPELPAALLGDPQRLTQVINNLLGNAVKFTEAGNIQLAARGRRRTAADVELEISVQDTGIGMTENDLSRAFTAFSQADDSKTRRFGGTGLGLVISRQLVELMGGMIRVESAPGKGSVFTVVISFPVAPGVRKGKLSARLRIPSPSGLDLEAGLKRLDGNRELYLKLLADFVAEHVETPAQLVQELRTDRREEVVRRAKAIKGVAGNIGGKDLEAAAAELERACLAAVNGVPFSLGEPLRAFIDCHEALIAAIGDVLARQPVVSPTKPERPPGDAAELSTLLVRLRKAIESKEPRPCKEILGILLQKKWSEDHETVLAELNRLVHRYRLEDALALLDREFDDIMRKEDERIGD